MQTDPNWSNFFYNKEDNKVWWPHPSLSLPPPKKVTRKIRLLFWFLCTDLSTGLWCQSRLFQAVCWWLCACDLCCCGWRQTGGCGGIKGSWLSDRIWEQGKIGVIWTQLLLIPCCQTRFLAVGKCVHHPYTHGLRTHWTLLSGVAGQRGDKRETGNDLIVSVLIIFITHFLN